MNLQDIRNLISQGDTRSAMKALDNLLAEDAFQNKRLRNDLILLSNRFEEINHKENIGILDQNDVLRAHTQLNNAILNLMEELEEARVSGRKKEEPEKPPPRPRRWKRFLLIGGASVTLIVIVAIFGPIVFLELNHTPTVKKSDEVLFDNNGQIHKSPIQDTVFVEGGVFTMGGNEEDSDRDEYPHIVLVNSFFIDRTHYTVI